MHTEPVNELGVYSGHDTLIDEPRDFREQLLQPEERLSVTRIYVKGVAVDRLPADRLPAPALTTRVRKSAALPRPVLGVILAVVCVLVGTIVGGAIAASGGSRWRAEAAALSTKQSAPIVTPIEVARRTEPAPVSPPAPPARAPDRTVQAPDTQTPTAQIAPVPAVAAVAASVTPVTADAPSPVVAAVHGSVPPPDPAPVNATPAKPSRHTRPHHHAESAPARSAASDDNASAEDDDSKPRAKQVVKGENDKADKAENDDQPEKPSIAKADKDTADGATGTLSVASKPPCQLSIDGKQTGLMTPQKKLKLPAGAHKVRFVNADQGIDLTTEIVIYAEEQRSLIQDFTE
jgi:hypothetical protein